MESKRRSHILFSLLITFVIYLTSCSHSADTNSLADSGITEIELNSNTVAVKTGNVWQIKDKNGIPVIEMTFEEVYEGPSRILVRKGPIEWELDLENKRLKLPYIVRENPLNRTQVIPIEDSRYLIQDTSGVEFVDTDGGLHQILFDNGTRYRQFTPYSAEEVRADENTSRFELTIDKQRRLILLLIANNERCCVHRVHDFESNLLFEVDAIFLLPVGDNLFVTRTVDDNKFRILDRQGKSVYEFEEIYLQPETTLRSNIVFKLYTGEYGVFSLDSYEWTAKFYSDNVTSIGQNVVATINGRVSIYKPDSKAFVETSFEDFSIENSNETHITASLDGKWGILDLDGNVIHEALYSELQTTPDGSILAKDGNNWAILNIQGDVVSLKGDGIFESPDPTSENGIVSFGTPRQSHFLDFDGKVIFKDSPASKFQWEVDPGEQQEDIALLQQLSPKFDGLGQPSEGLIAFFKWIETPEGLSYGFGYINYLGEIVIDAQYKFAFPFHNGVAIVSKDNEYYLIDKQGNRVTPENAYRLITNSDGDDYYITQKNNLYGILEVTNDSEIREVVSPKTWLVSELGDERFLVLRNDEPKELVIDVEENTYFTDFESISKFNEGAATFRRDNLWGLVDTQGNIITPPVYDAIQFESLHGLRVIEDERRKGVIDSEGVLVISPVWGDVEILRKDRFLAASYVEELNSIYGHDIYLTQLLDLDENNLIEGEYFSLDLFNNFLKADYCEIKAFHKEKQITEHNLCWIDSSESSNIVITTTQYGRGKFELFGKYYLDRKTDFDIYDLQGNHLFRTTLDRKVETMIGNALYTWKIDSVSLEHNYLLVTRFLSDQPTDSTVGQNLRPVHESDWNERDKNLKGILDIYGHVLIPLEYEAIAYIPDKNSFAAANTAGELVIFDSVGHEKMRYPKGKERLQAMVPGSYPCTEQQLPWTECLDKALGLDPSELRVPIN
ncbi:MAG: WG repeat-containing protein [Gammaproteobacteria bacterium]|nr:WG repeat-containing protein [Gammaproteobacteria bacterium]